MTDATAAGAGQALQKARAALESGDPAGCGQLAAAVLQKIPDSAEANYLLAVALVETGRLSPALPLIAKAAELAPANCEYQTHFARLLQMARKDAEARAAAMKAVACAQGASPLTLDTIGCVLARLGEHESARPLFEKAVAAEPDNLEFRFNLASTYGFFGQNDAAAEQYQAILERDPAHGKAHFGLVGLRRQKAEDNPLPKLDAAIARAQDPTDRLRIRYAASKVCQDIGEQERAVRYLDEANREHRSRLRFDFAEIEQYFAAIETAFARPDYFAGESDVSDGPIFVMGMPRTGTTLVDRILSAHPDVASAGELQAMPLAIKLLTKTRSRLVFDADTVRAGAGLAPREVGQAYLARARQHAGAESGIFTDKLPLNFLYIGYIARALPNAKLVCLRRNPMDTVWSNYKNLFATTSSYYHYSYDQAETAKFYLLFDRLMAFWEKLLPGRVLSFSYEDLVADQETRTRALLDHCGLSWSDACLDFHQQSSAVATPSARQVRQPLYNKAVGQWRPYGPWLKPAMDVFERAGIAVD